MCLSDFVLLLPKLSFHSKSDSKNAPPIIPTNHTAEIAAGFLLYHKKGIGTLHFSRKIEGYCGCGIQKNGSNSQKHAPLPILGERSKNKNETRHKIGQIT